MFPTTGIVRVGIDGISLYRPELADYWDCSVFLDVDRRVANDLMAHRQGRASGASADQNPRNVEGQQIYLETCHPSRVATMVIDNNALDHPSIAGSWVRSR